MMTNFISHSSVDFLLMWHEKVTARSAKMHCHVNKKMTFVDVIVTFFLPYQQKINGGVKQNLSTVQRRF
jgi:hypothetical protein